jgi:hypothetical protein
MRTQERASQGDAALDELRRTMDDRIKQLEARCSAKSPLSPPWRLTSTAQKAQGAAKDAARKAAADYATLKTMHDTVAKVGLCPRHPTGADGACMLQTSKQSGERLEELQGQLRQSQTSLQHGRDRIAALEQQVSP